MTRRATGRTRMPQARRSKYHAVPTTVDGFRFASGAEARRYGELLLSGLAGYVRNLELQPWWRLTVRDGVFPGATWGVVIGKYIADFRYERRDGFESPWYDVVEDVKGFKTPLYRWKKRHVEAEHDIVVHEVTGR